LPWLFCAMTYKRAVATEAAIRTQDRAHASARGGT